MRKIRVAILTFFTLAFFSVVANAQAPRTMNAAEIQLALKKLGVLCNVLHIGAHPDDENTALLAYLANERLCRTGYLSLTRGEGGQNLIGSEKGAALGVIRTQELLAARRIDGAEQFFTRAVDFGFSKTPQETFQKWDRQEVLSDVVWMIRKFRPDVVITRFPPDARAGHGHHQASAILAEEAFKLAGDAKVFPEQLKYVSIWQPKRLLWNAFVRQGDAPPIDALKVDVGTYNPLLGKSYTEIAAQSRSQHKSQGFGSAERRGSRIEYLTHVAGEKAQNNIFDGVETSWRRVAGGAEIQDLVNQANAEFNRQNPSSILDNLFEIKRRLPNPQISELKNEQGAVVNVVVNESLRKTFSDIDNLAYAVSGLWFEAIAAEPFATPDSETKVSVTAVNRLDLPIKQLAVYKPVSKGAAIPTTQFFPLELKSNQSSTAELTVYFGESTWTTQPYWLFPFDNERIYKVDGYLNVNGNTLDVPEDSAAYYFRFQTAFENNSLLLQVPLVYRFVDRVEGEIYRPFVIAPPLVLNLTEPLFVFSTAQPKQVKFSVRSNVNQINGVVKLDLPSGWQATPREIPISFAAKGTETTVNFTITPLANSINGKLIAFVEANGRRYDKRQITINYPHIPQQTLFPPAEASLVKLDIRIGKERIGYIVGSGDEIPEALRQINYDVKLLSDEEIANADLSANFDTIIAGIRAYNTRQILRKQNQRLLDFVKNGGNYVVQYNTNDETLFPNFAPFPLKIGRDRVTVEEAQVKFLDSNAAVLNFPNKITEKDFDGYVQERGLYFPSEFASEYQPILAMNDPNEKESSSSLLVANYGRGKFVYTGLSFFRQLPAGVPGAYRLFVNLISNEKK